jgi:RHS repeat-associated protein
MDDDKSVLCWGDGADGLLGTGDTTDHLTPYEITTLREVSDDEPYYEVDSHLTYHHSDHLGSTSIDTDEDGAVVQLVDYYPYGGTRLDEQAGEEDNPYKYNGKELDEDTGLYYYGARYYNAELARFTSQDPWGGKLSDPQTLNKYSYVLNNPLNFIDPTGEKVELVARKVKNLDNAVHTYLRITPDNPEDFGIDEEFIFTLGAYNDDDVLVAKMNDLSDSDPNDENILDTITIDAPEGLSDTEFIMMILDVHSRFEKQEYFWGGKVLGRNCNNYTTSLLEGAGSSIPDVFLKEADELRPGLNVSIPEMLDSKRTNRKFWQKQFMEKHVELLSKYDTIGFVQDPSTRELIIIKNADKNAWALD